MKEEIIEGNNREIKFRGFYKGIWVYGSYVHGINLGGDPLHQIENVNPNEHRVWNVPAESVGQFTGLKDKNGTEIYEGDVITIRGDKAMKVCWNKRFASFVLIREDWMYAHWFGESCNPEECEIIGNIYNNPDLLTPPTQQRLKKLK